MPIYEYGCTKCGEKFELLRRFSDTDNDVKCPKCGKGSAKRALSTFATSSSGEGCAPAPGGST